MDQKKQNYANHWLKLSLAFILCLFIRFIPFRAPNIEPLMTVLMPFSKSHGGSVSFFFAFFSIIVYDLATGTLGEWTLLTSVSYGLVALGSALYFSHRKATAWNFAIFATIGTIFFDIVTGLLTGPLFFDQSFYVALMGQIPFTILHLLGNVSFALIVSPAIYKFLVKKRKVKHSAHINIFNHKTI